MELASPKNWDKISPTHLGTYVWEHREKPVRVAVREEKGGGQFGRAERGMGRYFSVVEHTKGSNKNRDAILYPPQPNKKDVRKETVQWMRENPDPELPRRQ
jgi:hypothetical protein